MGQQKWLATVGRVQRLMPLASTVLGSWQRMGTSRKTVVFHFRFPMNFVVCKHLLLRLTEDHLVNVAVCLQCDDPVSRQVILRLVRESIGPLPAIDADQLYGLRFDVLVTPIWELAFHHLPRLRRLQHVRRLLGLGSFKSVQVFHGLTEKNGAAVGNRELAEQFDYLFLLNRRAYRYYERLGMPAERMRLVGFGKLDALVRGRVETVSLAKKLGINGRPVVLYAPTWEFVNESPDLLEGVVHKLGRVNAKTLVKLHDLTYRHYEGSGFLDRLQQQNRSVSFVHEEDSSRCLALADLLISDVSSIAYEYLVLDRPVVFVETPEMIRRFAAKEMGLEIEMRYCGHIVQALDGLPALVESCLANPKEKAGARREVSEEVLFKPGTAVDRATEEIYGLLGTEKPGTAP